MSSFNTVKEFEITIEEIQNISEIVHLVIKINTFNFFRFPYCKSNINDLINIFQHVIDGKERTIDLNFDYNYNLITFQKDRIMISLLNDKTTYLHVLTQELRIFFENNSIVRNGLRKFIDEISKI